MHDRLSKLLLASPPAETPWSGPPPEWQHPPITRRDGKEVHIELPLFWYDPAWHQLPTDRANALAFAVGRLGILLAALRSDLASANSHSAFHDDPVESDVDDGSQPSSQSRYETLGRIVPYRPERYGLSARDFDGARVIDVRLTMHRDETGRFAYSAAQIERWEATPTGHPVSGGSWVPSATFPPDVASMEHLAVKLDQLRSLAPQAAVFVTLGPWHLPQDLTAVIASQPDGVILRLDELNADGIDLACLTRQTRRLVDQAGGAHLPLWIVPGPISVDDAAKLVALGASAVAIDGWCDELWDAASGQSHSTSARLGFSGTLSTSVSQLSRIVTDELVPMVNRFRGLLSSLQVVPQKQCLTSLDPQWCERLGLPTQGMPPGKARS